MFLSVGRLVPGLAPARPLQQAAQRRRPQRAGLRRSEEDLLAADGVGQFGFGFHVERQGLLHPQLLHLREAAERRWVRR
jgi:hypothetical protein